MPEYKHKSIEKLSELFLKHKDEISKGTGMMGMMWKAIAPSVPELFRGLDEDEELLDKVHRFLISIVEAMGEELPLEPKESEPVEEAPAVETPPKSKKDQKEKAKDAEGV